MKLTKTKNPLILHVTKAKYISDYKLWLEFNDGTSGQINLEDKLDGTLEPLNDVSIFKNFAVKYSTVIWSDKMDLAPEYLHDLMFEQAGVTASK